MLLCQFILPVTSLILFSACGGGSSSEGNDTYHGSYLQFYDGSANSATTTLTLTDSDDAASTLGTAAFANSYNVLVAEKDPDTETGDK